MAEDEEFEFIPQGEEGEGKVFGATGEVPFVIIDGGISLGPSATVVEGANGIYYFAFLQAFYSLKIAVMTGFRPRTPLLRVVKNRYGLKARTMKGAFEEMAELHKEAVGHYPTGYETYLENRDGK